MQYHQMDSAFAVLFCELSASCSEFKFTMPSGWDMHDSFYSKELSVGNRANGYRDVIASIDLSTYRRIPWENNVPFFLLSFLDPDTKKPLIVDPRGILKMITDRAAGVGNECFAGIEYEVCLFRDSSGTPSDIVSVFQFQG